MTDVTDVTDLLAFLDACPSPHHAVAEAARRLVLAGATEVDLADPWPESTGLHVLVRDGALVAWNVPDGAAPHLGFRIVGAHTDSPALKIKPRPDTGAVGWRQLAVEVYGGALLNSWLDRDLGLAGRVAVRSADGIRHHLLRVERPLMRVPQLAIHLDRDVNGAGLKLNPQQHLTPIWGVGSVSEGDFVGFVADELGVDAGSILAWDLICTETTPAALLGRDQELIASGRLDNLVSCWAALEALASASRHARDIENTPLAHPHTGAAVPVIALFDHEEVGSVSATGADGTLLAHVLERSVLARGGSRDDFLRALASSRCASADMAHAVHPNYPERHEPGHHIAIDGGPVIKVNANQRYATDAGSAAAMIEACRVAGVPHQMFVGRNDQPCGSTIGPLTASRLGIPTVDVGVAQLSMHSSRELCGVEDPARLAAALGAFVVG